MDIDLAWRARPGTLCGHAAPMVTAGCSGLASLRDTTWATERLVFNCGADVEIFWTSGPLNLASGCAVDGETWTAASCMQSR